MMKRLGVALAVGLGLFLFVCAFAEGAWTRRNLFRVATNGETYRVQRLKCYWMSDMTYWGDVGGDYSSLEEARGYMDMWVSSECPEPNEVRLPDDGCSKWQTVAGGTHFFPWVND